MRKTAFTILLASFLTSLVVAQPIRSEARPDPDARQIWAQLRSAAPAAAQTSAPERAALLGAPGLGADIVVLGDLDAETRRALPLQDPGAGVALPVLLRLVADREALERPDSAFGIARLLPQRFAPYVAPQYRDALRDGGWIAPGAWAGDDEFARAETRRRFLAAERDAYLRLPPELPVTVARVRSLIIRGEYNAGREIFSVELPFHGGGLASQVPGIVGEFQLAAPYRGLTELPMPPEMARRLRERQAALLAAERARRRNPNLQPLAPGPHQFLVVERYRIADVRMAGRDVVAQAEAVDVRIFDPTNLATPFAVVPIPAGAVVAGTRPAMPAPAAEVIYDDEVPLLLMAKANPALQDDRNFITASFTVRRQIERDNRTACAGPQASASGCTPTSWQNLIPPTLVTSSAGASQADLAAYGEALKRRIAALGDTIIVPTPCSVSHTVCRRLPAGRTQVDLAAIFGGNSTRPEEQRAAQPVAPDAPRVSNATAATRIRALSAVATPLGVRVLVAQRLNAAWDGVTVPDPADLAIVFRIGRSGFGAAFANAQTFVIELEPVALVTRGARTPLEAPAPSAGDASVPSAPWDVLGVRLGMPIEEAERVLQSQFAGSATTPLVAAPVIEGPPQCQSIWLTSERGMPQRLFELERQERANGGAPFTPARREAATREIRAAAMEALRNAGCPDPEARPVVFGFGIDVQHDPNRTRQERLVLFRTGTALGPPVVSAIFRGLSVPEAEMQGLRNGLTERYGTPHLILNPRSADPTFYWFDVAARRVQFSAPQAACAIFWPGAGTDAPSIPGPYLDTDCGVLMRFDKSRLLVVDTRFLSRAAQAAAQRRSEQPAPRQTPSIRF